jgi:predicted component of type VI protein secretion system
MHRYWEHVQDDAVSRQAALVAVLRDARQGVGPDEAIRTLDLIAVRFSDREAEAAKLANRSGTVDTGSTTSRDEQEIATVRSVFQRVLDLASQSVEKPDLTSGAAQDAFLDRLERAWRIMLEGLADSVKGRRQFESEFDAHSTRIFSWTPNPIKHAESAQDIAAYLLDWRRPESVERIAADLQEVLTDLALHQMGLMAGFKESVRGLLERLDPETLETEAREGTFGLGSVKAFGPRAAWQHFKDVHRTLSEEEVKTFETVLGPHFVRGYLSVQRKKART